MFCAIMYLPHAHNSKTLHRHSFVLLQSQIDRYALEVLRTQQRRTYLQLTTLKLQTNRGQLWSVLVGGSCHLSYVSKFVGTAERGGVVFFDSDIFSNIKRASKGPWCGLLRTFRGLGPAVRFLKPSSTQTW